MKFEFLSKNVEKTYQLASVLADLLFEGSVILMHGQLGSGKTAFAKGVGKGLGIKETITSPTFNIVRCYFNGKLPLYHIDAYRLEGMTQDLGFEEIFEDDGVCIVEWPHFIDSILPEERLQITLLRVDESSRLAKIEGIGQRYQEMEKCLK